MLALLELAEHGRWQTTPEVCQSLPPTRGRLTPGVAMLLAVSEGKPVDLTVEWTPHGVIPLSIHLPDRTVDVGPRANTTFVSAA